MPTSIVRSLVVIAAVTLTLPVMLSMPALASPKRTGISQSLAGIVKMLDNYCSDTHDRLIAAEVGAEADAGTPAGDASEKDADAQWQKGADAGCSWAA